MFHTTNSTLSLSLPEMLHRRIVDHHITSCMPPLPIWIIPISVQVLQHSTICKNTLALSSALHKSTDSAHLMYTYPASHSMAMHRANTICSLFFAICLFYSFHAIILLFYMLFQIIPHAHCPSLPIMFQFFLYISIKYLSCIFQFRISNLVHPVEQQNLHKAVVMISLFFHFYFTFSILIPFYSIRTVLPFLSHVTSS